MYCMYGSMAKDTSRAEVTLKNEKIKLVALAIDELCESEGISQAVSQLTFFVPTMNYYCGSWYITIML